jgi:hypothetical protein
MKKQIFFLLTFLTISSLKSLGQITLEHTFHKYHTPFFVTDIGNNDIKYVFQDTSGFKLYNLDYSLFLSVTAPIPINTAPQYNQVSYITKSLFDCDSSNIEYVINSTNYYVYRTDGTLLFEKDSAIGPYEYGWADGSVEVHPIFNTPMGTKLLLMNLPQDSISVYSLCGVLPTMVEDHLLSENFVRIFPNPSNRIINFEINSPNNFDKFKLTIYDSSFHIVDQKNITERNYQIDLNIRSLSSGTYFFDFRTDSKVFQTGKFVIIR